VTCADQGIGHALACKYAETGTHVVAVGRRQQQLDELAKQHKGMISTKVFDIAKLDQIPKFVDEIIAEHPDLECVFLNRYHPVLEIGIHGSGMQRGFNFMKPETVDVSQIDLEVTTNYLSYIHLYFPLINHF